MPGHSRPKDGVASLAYAPASTPFLSSEAIKQEMDGRDKPGHDVERSVQGQQRHRSNIKP
jgi:hypothetical protein